VTFFAAHFRNLRVRGQRYQTRRFGRHCKAFHRPLHGFTLVELLVVIAIIAILLSVLMPALSAAKEMARATDCLVNQRSLSMAVWMYITESDGSYPAAWNIYTSPSIAWCGGYYKQDGVKYMDVTMSPLWPYIQQKKVLACKSYTPTGVKYPGSGQISGFGINCQYVAGDPVVDTGDGYYGMTSYARPAKESQIAKPAETILFADCSRVKGGVHTEDIFVFPLYKHDSSDRNYATFHFRHKQEANAAFCDGHVGSIAPLELDPAGDGLCGWMGNKVMDRK